MSKLSFTNDSRNSATALVDSFEEAKRLADETMYKQFPAVVDGCCVAADWRRDERTNKVAMRFRFAEHSYTMDPVTQEVF